MSNDFMLVPECWADTVLTEFLHGDSRFVTKAEGTQVAQQMREYPRSIGVIDDDKHKVPYFRAFETIVTEKETQLQLCKNPHDGRFLIILIPAVEKWLYHAAQIASVHPPNYGFPPHLNEKVFLRRFCTVTKSVSLPMNADFMRFLKDILTQESLPMLRLQQWIRGQF